MSFSERVPYRKSPRRGRSQKVTTTKYQRDGRADPRWAANTVDGTSAGTRFWRGVSDHYITSITSLRRRMCYPGIMRFLDRYRSGHVVVIPPDCCGAPRSCDGTMAAQQPTDVLSDHLAAVDEARCVAQRAASAARAATAAVPLPRPRPFAQTKPNASRTHDGATSVVPLATAGGMLHAAVADMAAACVARLLLYPFTLSRRGRLMSFLFLVPPARWLMRCATRQHVPRQKTPRPRMRRGGAPKPSATHARARSLLRQGENMLRRGGGKEERDKQTPLDSPPSATA